MSDFLNRPHLRQKAYGMALAVLLCAGSALVITGCQSNIPDIATKTHGSKAGDGYTYGTGPNKTRPYPQTEPVNLNGVGGAAPKYEPVSRGGNKDYTVLGQNYMVWTDCTSYQEIGTASWYGPGFHGNKTSNGELYDQKGFTAAHKNLPLPSFVKVTNLENGRAVIVRVNDRGPFHGSRIIDLSEGAAKKLDMTKKGTAKVKLELINTRGFGNIANTDEPGQKPTGTGGVLGQVIEHTTTTTTQNHLSNLGEFISDMKNGGSSDLKTTAAAVGAGIYFAGKLGDALDNGTGSASSRSTAAGGSASQANSYTAGNTATRTVTTTTTNSSGVTQTTRTVDTYNLNGTQPNYTVDYMSPELSTSEPGTAYVQFFSSTSQSRAARIQTQLREKTPYPVIVVSEEGLFRVRIGPVPERDLSTSLEYMKQLGYPDAFIKRIPAPH